MIIFNSYVTNYQRVLILLLPARPPCFGSLPPPLSCGLKTISYDGRPDWCTMAFLSHSGQLSMDQCVADFILFHAQWHFSRQILLPESLSLNSSNTSPKKMSLQPQTLWVCLKIGCPYIHWLVTTVSHAHAWSSFSLLLCCGSSPILRQTQVSICWLCIPMKIHWNHLKSSVKFVKLHQTPWKNPFQSPH